MNTDGLPLKFKDVESGERTMKVAHIDGRQTVRLRLEDEREIEISFNAVELRVTGDKDDPPARIDLGAFVLPQWQDGKAVLLRAARPSDELKEQAKVELARILDLVRSGDKCADGWTVNQTQSISRLCWICGLSEQEQAFVVDALSNPRDTTPLLAMADWLQEQGRAEGEMLASFQTHTDDERRAIQWAKKQFHNGLVGCDQDSLVRGYLAGLAAGRAEAKPVEEPESKTAPLSLSGEEVVQAEIRRALKQMVSSLDNFEQTTHGLIGPFNIAAVMQFIADCYRSPSAYNISNASQAIKAFLAAEGTLGK